MISGPLPLRLVGELLGKGEAAMKALVQDETEEFPTITINTETKPMLKVLFYPLLHWLNKSATVPITAEELDAQLERCEKAIAARDERKRDAKAMKQAQAA